MYSNSLEYRIRRCLTAIPMLELKALLRFSHIRGARYEGKKGNADPKHRPVSSAIFGPVDILLFFVFHLGRISPEVGVSRFSISIPAYQRKTPWISFCRMVLITNYFTFLLRSFSGDLASPRLSGRKFHPCAPLSFDFGFGSFYWLYSKLLRYARGPGHCCAGNYCRSRKKMLYFG
jgi:hypothetical protein